MEKNGETQGSKKTPRSVELQPWEETAREILVSEMRSRKITYKRLSQMLEEFDIDEMPGRINRKVHRAQFSAGFFLACLSTMGVERLPLPEASAVPHGRGPDDGSQGIRPP